jgi:RNA polymerase sigma-70 factor (ECF subfamily)
MSNGKSHYERLKDFKTLFEALYRPLCLFANSYLHDIDTSKDIVQEVFIKIWEKKPSFKNYSTAKAYFYTTVKNHCLNYLKSKHYRTMERPAAMDLALLQSEDYLLAEMVAAETYAQLHRVIGQLPEKTGKVVQLSLNKYTTEEIAEELSVTQSTVRTQKSIAYKKLKGLLGHFNCFFTAF